ncbi:MAG: cytochrome c [Bryobacteraceae bacterium]
MLRTGVLISFVLLGSLAAQNMSKGPLPYTRKSIELGKQVFLRNCTSCHDRDGRSLSGRDFTQVPPADLTDPDAYVHGKSAPEIFRNIREGTKDEMPPYKNLKDDDIWHMANFVRSLWPEAARPKLEDEPK